MNEDGATNSESYFVRNLHECTKYYYEIISLLEKYNLLNNSLKRDIATNRYYQILHWHVNRMLKSNMLNDVVCFMVTNDDFYNLAQNVDQKRMKTQDKFITYAVVKKKQFVLRLIYCIKVFLFKLGI